MDFTRRSVQFAVLAFLAVIWGSSFIMMKRGLAWFDGSEVAALRMSVALGVLLPIALRNLALLRRRAVPLFLVGLFGNTLPAFLFAYAQTVIPSFLSGMLNSLTSLWTLLLGVAFFRMRPSRLQSAGVLIALVGTLGLIGFRHLSALSDYGRYSLLVVAATACYGIAVNITKSHLHDVSPARITALAYLLTAPALTIYLLVGTDFLSQLVSDPSSWWGVLYVALLGLLATVLAVVIFNKLIHNSTPVFAASVTYLIPVVAVGWGLADGESIAADQLGYLVLVLAGIFLINLPTGLLRRLRS